jgi:hypothetical protein
LATFSLVTFFFGSISVFATMFSLECYVCIKYIIG